MGIKHAFVNPKADGGDATVARPSDWNDDHTIEPGTIELSHLAAEVLAVLMPVGSIVMWSGDIASIPDPWALCDGVANAPGPDLRDKFVVGAREDEGGVAKTDIEGTLKVTGGVTGHSHSAHANLSHAGGAVGDHTGLTHSVQIANHPDLTHAALSHAASTFSHADHNVASVSHSHAPITLTHADHSVPSFSGTDASRADLSVPSGAIASRADLSRPSMSHAHAASTLTLSLVNTSGAATGATSLRVAFQAGATTMTGPVIASHSGTQASAADVSLPSLTIPSAANASIPSQSHSHAAATLTHPDHSVPSFSGTGPATTLTHNDHSFPSLSHQAIGTHVGTDYGVHSITQPAAHGAAGTLVHAFTQPDPHAISPHDTVLSLPNYHALAYIQLMAA